MCIRQSHRQGTNGKIPNTRAWASVTDVFMWLQRTVYLNDSRHLYLYLLEPRMQLEDDWPSAGDVPDVPVAV